MQRVAAAMSTIANVEAGRSHPILLLPAINAIAKAPLTSHVALHDARWRRPAAVALAVIYGNRTLTAAGLIW